MKFQDFHQNRRRSILQSIENQDDNFLNGLGLVNQLTRERQAYASSWGSIPTTLLENNI